MSPEFVVQLLRDVLITALMISAPLLIAGFVAGVAVSLVQTLTSIQDSAFSAIPRLLTFLATFVILLPWMLNKLMAYTTHVFADLSRYAK